jgi:spermidine synthase
MKGQTVSPVSASSTSTKQITHPNISADGWFRESQSFWPSQQFSLLVTQPLFSATSKYQQILVFKSESYGNVLVLDGVIQATEKDEFAYQEMIVNLPFHLHPNPKHILVIGTYTCMRT